MAERPGAYGAAPALAPAPAPGVALDGAADLKLLRDDWHGITERVGKLAIMAKSALHDARPLEVTGTTVVIGVDEEFESELKELEVSRVRKAVEQVLGSLLRRTVSVRYQATNLDAPRKVEPAAKAVAPATGKSAERAAEPPPPAPRQERSKRDWANEPAVQKALDMFEGTITDVRE